MRFGFSINQNFLGISYFVVPGPFHDIRIGIGAWHRPFTDRFGQIFIFTLNIYIVFFSTFSVFGACLCFRSHFHACEATV